MEPITTLSGLVEVYGKEFDVMTVGSGHKMYLWPRNKGKTGKRVVRQRMFRLEDNVIHKDCYSEDKGRLEDIYKGCRFASVILMLVKVEV